eukprot:CAMPEP_0171937492 /NCGR_PEP_ID=MMETSP0993-20121228/34659_1 /TAXON_ID=483369 /ORGANISM="non described non described, Strain CCMP2098" /LENGTH=272 /DNA_ID=CAMNT_0012578853 /DNA_START=188 /DNA_END=1006 /DNA_ORIENTATION=+
MFGPKAAVLLAALLGFANKGTWAFQPSSHSTRLATAGRAAFLPHAATPAAPSETPNEGGLFGDLFESARWPAVQKELDVLPMFTCSNEQGQPLQYDVGGVPRAMFYADVTAAKAELEQSRSKFPDLAIDLVPFPLGQVFQAWQEGDALVVPSASAMRAAGAPAGASPVGQQVPLFACMGIMREREGDGRPVLPLFLVYEEAVAARNEALVKDGPGAGDGDGGNGDVSEVVALSLLQAVQLLATTLDDGNEEAPAYQFVPPEASVQHIREYLA